MIDTLFQVSGGLRSNQQTNRCRPWTDQHP